MVVIILQETRNTYPTFHGKFGKNHRLESVLEKDMLDPRVDFEDFITNARG